MNDYHKRRMCAGSASVRKTLRKLIRDVRGLDLEAGRDLAFEDLRTLPIDPPLIERILRQVAEQRSKEDLLKCLESFAGTFRAMSLHKLNTCLAFAWRFLTARRSQ